MTEPYWRPFRSGHRKSSEWMVPALQAAAATQGRAITTRRFLYLLTDPPDTAAGAALADLIAAEPRIGALLAQGKKKAEERISATLSEMREVGLLHPALLHDGRSDSIEHPSWPGADAWLDEAREDADRLALDRQTGQPRYREVWTEAADTLADLQAVCEEYGVPLYSSSGNRTLGALDRLGKRIVADVYARFAAVGIAVGSFRPAMLLYVGDFDPPGLSFTHDLADAAAVWAHRWLRERHHRQGGLPPDEAWRAACDEVRDDPGPFVVTVNRVAVTQDDLDGRACSVVNPAQAEQYRRFWPEGETRTLQVEGLAIAEVVGLVSDALAATTDAEALAAIKAQEADERRRAVSAIGEPAADGPNGP